MICGPGPEPRSHPRRDGVPAFRPQCRASARSPVRDGGSRCRYPQPLRARQRSPQRGPCEARSPSGLSEVASSRPTPRGPSMPDVPFRRVADAAEPRRRVAVAGLLHTPRSVAADKASQGSRRRKLWDLLAKFHCPVVGVCFEVNELRTLISRVMHFPREAADFMLHTTAVGTCDTRSRLSEVLQKDLERRFPLAVRHFSGARSADGVRALWRESCKTGSDIFPARSGPVGRIPPVTRRWRRRSMPTST